MHPELQSLIETNKLTSDVVEALEALTPGTYCLHKSWGFGRVASWQAAENQILIDFGPRKNHPMQLAYAAQTLQAVPPDHLLARKAEDPAAVKKMASEDVTGLIKLILRYSPDRRATAAQISALLVPGVFTEAEFKRWWEFAKKALKKTGGFVVPAKKADFLEERESGQTDAATDFSSKLIERFQAARQPKEQLALLDQIIAHIDEFKSKPEVLTELVQTVGRIASQNQRLNPSKSLELFIARDEIAKVGNISIPADAPTLHILVVEGEMPLAAIIDSLPAARQRQALEALPSVLGEDRWVQDVLNIFPSTRTARLIGEIVRLLESRNQTQAWQSTLNRAVRDYSISCEMCLWMARERHGICQPLMTNGGGLRLYYAILSALDRDRYGDIKRGTKLRDLLISDRELICDLLEGCDPGALRAAGRALLASPVFEELDRRSLLARLIKVHPALNELLHGGEEEKQPAPLIVSWSSLEKRKNEYEELVNKKIPENSKEIGVARSYGDLRENFEFKAAKEMQTVLLRRKGELEIALARARGTNFENPDTNQVSIGTIVRLQNSNEGEEETYTILGAWDGEPERHIVSYQTAIGQSLLGHRVGETIELPAMEGSVASEPRQMKIVSIEAYQGAAVKASA